MKKDLSELLMLMFPHLLKSAIQAKVFSNHQCYNHNGIQTYMGVYMWANTCEILFHSQGNLLIHTHEYSRDVTQLIRHTIEFMQSTHFGRCVLSSCRETTENIKIINIIPPYIIRWSEQLLSIEIWDWAILIIRNIAQLRNCFAFKYCAWKRWNMMKMIMKYIVFLFDGGMVMGGICCHTS